MNLPVSPKVTVLMPVYNGETYLGEAIKSILNQTFTDFEFLIINDGSSDESLKIINSYKDKRIRLISNDKNVGLVNTLNKGIALSCGQYIARMDCDDISLPERLAKQVAYMDSQPEVCVCGTWIRTIGEIYGDVWDYPSDDSAIRCSLLFGSVIAHPSVIIRKGGLEKYQLFYDARYTHAEDYELWVRCSKYMLLANIPEVLVLYRMHKQQIVKRECQGKEKSASRIRSLQIEDLGVFPTPEEIEIHLALSTWRFQPTYNFVEQADLWLIKLQIANINTSRYPEPAFSETLAEKWFAVCNSAVKLGSRIWKKYWISPLSQSKHLHLSQKLKFAVKCYLQ